MMLFFTQSTRHLAEQFSHAQMGSYTAKKFSDGELYIKLHTDVAHKKVWVIAATNAPADNLIELFLLLDALQRAQATIYLLFTYFGYARQDKSIEHEASSAHMIATFLKTFDLKKIVIIHAHSELLHNYLNFENVIPHDLICQKAALSQALVSPDQGAYELVKGLSNICNVPAIFLSKIRPAHEMVQILKYDGVIRADNVLIVDDIIATGNTIIEVAKLLAQAQVETIKVWATHGFFTHNAIEAFEQSPISKIYVTNTLPHHKKSKKLEVISIVPLLEHIIMQI